MKSFHRRTSRPAPEPKVLKPVVSCPDGRVRVDRRLVELGLAASRSVARELIDSGRVSLDGTTIFKASHEVGFDAVLQVASDDWDEIPLRGLADRIKK